jgi:hypothetical protein
MVGFKPRKTGAVRTDSDPLGGLVESRWEPPVGIEPTTYSLRVRSGGSLEPISGS